MAKNSITHIDGEGAHHDGAGPVVRDLNRNLTALLGPCPATVDGRWVEVKESFPGAWTVVFPDLALDQALRLSTALAKIDESVGLAAVARELPAAASYDLSRVLHTAPATPASAIHVEVPR